MPTQFLFTRFLNHHFAAPVTALLHALHVQPAYPRGSDYERVCDGAAGLPGAAGLLHRGAADAERGEAEAGAAPGGDDARVRHRSRASQIIGHGSERFVSYLTALLLFILLSNLLGLVPGLESPTANVVVPLGFALVTFLYYHYHGIRANGFGYIKQFLGPVWWLSWLLLPIEIISHFARVLSLTVRLYANMFAGDLLTLAFFSLIPIGIPLVFLGLHLGVAVVQAYVFFLLAAIYLSMAVAHDH